MMAGFDFGHLLTNIEDTESNFADAIRVMDHG
jgi:hypothetical protein